tara:strand:+ start:79 stop:357 length:279 start_codon:yes stop_codon:yes gene_type:complete
MEYGSKTQATNISNLERGSVHEHWENGDAARVFTKAEGWPRAIRVDVAGTLIIKDLSASPVEVTYNVLQAEIIPFAISNIAAASTASVQIWW